MTDYFANITPQQREEYQRRATEAKRTPALKKAWANATKLRKEHETLSVKDIAKKHNISERSTNRILTGK